MSLPTDEELLAASRSDAQVFTDLFDRHFATIHRYLQRRVGPSLADELAAETFLRAFQHRDRYDAGRGTVRVWLFGIATNLLRRHHRSEHRRLSAYARAPQARATEDETAGVDDRVAAVALGPRLARALARTRRQDRDVLVLIAWADLSYAEAAVALDIPIGTVRSRLARARRDIRKNLPHDDLAPAALDASGNRKGVVING